MKRIISGLLLANISMSALAFSNQEQLVRHVMDSEMTDEVEPNASAIVSYMEDVVDRDSFKQPDHTTYAGFEDVKSLAYKRRTQARWATAFGVLGGVGLFGSLFGILLGSAFIDTPDESMQNFGTGLLGASVIGGVGSIGSLITSAIVSPSDQDLHNVIAKYNRLDPKRKLRFATSLAQIRQMNSQAYLNQQAGQQIMHQNVRDVVRLFQ